MEVNVEDYGRAIALHCSGALVLECADAAKDYLRNQLKACSCLVLDLSAMEELDSAGLAVLIYARNQAWQQGGHVKLAQVSTAVRQILDDTGVSRVFDIFETVDAALDSFMG